MTLLESTRPAELLAPAARTAGLTSPALDRNNFGRAQEWLFLTHIGAVAGTTPSMSLQVQDSDDNITFANVGVAQAYTTVGLKEFSRRNTRRFVRVVVTMTGTTPSFTFGLVAVAGEALDSGI